MLRNLRRLPLALAGTLFAVAGGAVATGSALAAVLLVLVGCAVVTDSAPLAPAVPTTNGGAAVWARTITSGGVPGQVYAAAADAGHVYMAGNRQGAGTYDFGDSVSLVFSDSLSTAFLVQYNRAGAAQWVAAPSSSSYSGFAAAATDSEGNVYAAGYAFNAVTVDFGNGVTAAGTGLTNALLVKYDASGKALWAHILSGSASESAGEKFRRFQGVAVDADNVYAVGFAGEKHYPLVAKYSLSGTPVWAQTVTNVADSAVTGGEFSAAALDGLGHLYAAGGASTGGLLRPLLIQFDSAGTVVSTKAVSYSSSTASGQFYAAAFDGQGNLYAVGSVRNPEQTSLPLDFGGVTVQTPFHHNSQLPFLVRYRSGTTQWVRTPESSLPGAMDAEFRGLAVDPKDNVYVSGTFRRTGADLDLGNDVTLPGGSDGSSAFLLRYDAGLAQWSRVPASSAASYFQNMVMSPSAELYVVGSLNQGTFHFETVTVASNRQSIPVLVKFQ